MGSRGVTVMAVRKRKAALGLVITVASLAVVMPIAYWFLSRWLSIVFGLEPVLERPVSLILSAASVLIGVFWVSWAYSYLVFVGKGLPLEVFGWALHPTQVLVTTGPYAYTRNPMVLGELFILLGVAFLAGSIPGLVLVPIIGALFYLYLVEFEERFLVRRFGSDYEEYRNNVPALMPRPSAYVHQPVSNYEL